MEPHSDTLDPPPEARAELSLEISRLVARVISGEEIDTAAKGAELAARFPEAGMSGDMIAEAIVSAAGMVGMIRRDSSTSETQAAEGDHESTDELVGALAAELGELEADAAADDATQANGNGAALADGNGTSETTGAPNRRGGVVARGAFAAVRRAFFRG